MSSSPHGREKAVQGCTVLGAKELPSASIHWMLSLMPEGREGFMGTAEHSSPGLGREGGCSWISLGCEHKARQKETQFPLPKCLLDSSRTFSNFLSRASPIISKWATFGDNFPLRHQYSVSLFCFSGPAGPGVEPCHGPTKPLASSKAQELGSSWLRGWLWGGPSYRPMTSLQCISSCLASCEKREKQSPHSWHR